MLFFSSYFDDFFVFVIAHRWQNCVMAMDDAAQNIRRRRCVRNIFEECTAFSQMHAYAALSHHHRRLFGREQHKDNGERPRMDYVNI